MRPYCRDPGALQEGESVGAGLMREQDGEAYGRIVEAAVVVQLADGHAERLPGVGVLGFDQCAPLFYPQVAEHRPDLPGPVLLPADRDSLCCHVSLVTVDKPGLGAVGFP